MHPIRHEPLVVLLPESHRLAAEAEIDLTDLADEPFLTYPSDQRSVVHDAVLDACQAAVLSMVNELVEGTVLDQDA